MPNHLKLILISVCLTFLSLHAANATCDKPNSIFFDLDEKISTVKVPVVITDGSKCISHYSSDTNSFETTKVLKNPSHGKINHKELTRFVYVPDSNYKGNDSYAYQLCGSGRTGKKGCVNIEFDVKLQ